MTRFRLLLFTVFLAICYLSFAPHATAQYGDITIDAVTLLLPSHVCSDKLKPVQRTVKAHGGCFTWHTSSPHIVSVTPNVSPETQCVVNGVVGTTEAVVAVVYDESLTTGKDGGNLYRGRRSAWIWADDLYTGRKGECEVFVDHIESLLIATSTRRINVGDTEVLHLQAFDEHGDVFSTLEGLPFEWTNSNNQIAHSISFGNANVNVSSTRLALERAGFGTDLLPLLGHRLGRTTFAATFQCKDLPQPVTASVDMLVTEPLRVSPTLLRICPSSRSAMQLFARQHKTFMSGSNSTAIIDSSAPQRPITLPSVHYKWSSDDPSVASIHPELGVVTAHATGHTKLHVTDVTLNERAVSSDVLVTQPYRLEMLLYRRLSRDQLQRVTTPQQLQSQLQHVLGKKGMVTEQDVIYHQIYENALPRCGTDSVPAYHLLPNTTYFAQVLVLDQQGRIIDVCDEINAQLLSTINAFESVSIPFKPGTGLTSIGSTSAPQFEKVITLDSTGLLSFTTSDIDPGLGSHASTLNLALVQDDQHATPTLLSKFSLHITPPPRPVQHSSILLPVAEGGCPMVLRAELGSGAYLWSHAMNTTTSIAATTAHARGRGATNAHVITMSSASDTQARKISPSSLNASGSHPHFIAGRQVNIYSADVEGITSIVLYDSCNPDAFHQLHVETSLPAQVGLYPHSVELPVSKPTQLVYQISDVKGRLFSTTECITLSTSVGDQTASKAQQVVTISSHQATYHPNCSNILKQQLQDPANVLSQVSITSQLQPVTEAGAGGANAKGMYATQADGSYPYGCYSVSLLPSHPGFVRVTASLPASYQTKLTSYWSSVLKSSPSLVKSLGVKVDNKYSYALSLYLDKTHRSPYPYHYAVTSQVFAVYEPIQFDISNTDVIVGATNTAIPLRWKGGPLPYPSLGFLPSATTPNAFGYDSCHHLSSTESGSDILSASTLSCLPHTFQPDKQVELTVAHSTDLSVMYRPTSIYSITTSSSNGDANRSAADVVVIQSQAYKSPEGTSLHSSAAGAVGHDLTVTCLHHHPTTGTNITIQAGNQPSLYNAFPHVGSTSLSVRCYAPICPIKREQYVGVGQQWTVLLQDHPLSKEFRYISQDTNIATVDENGVVKGVSLGVTLIHITIPKDNYYGLSAYVVVYVTFNGFAIHGEPVITQHQQQVYSVAGKQGETSVDHSFRYVNVQWHLVKGHHQGLASGDSVLTPDQLEKVGQLIDEHSRHQHQYVFQPLTSTPAIPSTETGFSGGATGGSSSLVSSLGDGSNTRNVYVDGSSVRVGSNTSGQSTLVARVTVHYPAPSDALLAHVASHPLQCGGKSPITVPPNGSVQEYLVAHRITVEPALVLQTPSSVTVPPDGSFRISTNLDLMANRKVTYSVVPLTPLLTSVTNTTAVHAQLVTVTPTGQAIIAPASVLERYVGHTNYDAVIVLRTDSTALQTSDTVSVHVHVRQPTSLDLLPVPSHGPPTAMSSSATTASAGATAAAMGSGVAGLHISAGSHQHPSDFTKRSRFLLFSDPTGDGSHGTVDSLIEPLCRPSSAVSNTHHSYLDQFAGYPIDLAPAPSLPPTNVTMTLVLRDVIGQLFDSIQLQGNQRGTVLVQVDPQHADMMTVIPQYINPSYDLSGAAVRNPSKSSKNTKMTSTTAKDGSKTMSLPLTTSASASSSMGISPQSVLAGLTFVANSPYHLTEKSQVVTFKISVALGGKTDTTTSATASNSIRPVYIQLRLGSSEECNQLYQTPLGLRLAVPIKLPSTEGSHSTPAFTGGSLDAQRSMHAGYLADISRRVSLITQLAIRDAVSQRVNSVFATDQSIDTVTVQVPTYHTYVRSVDTFAGYALVDLVRLHGSYLNDTTVSLGSTHTAVRHLHQQHWRVPAAVSGATTTTTGDSTPLAISSIDVAIAFSQRFNVTIPTLARSKHAAALLPSYAVAPNIALTGNEPTFPFRTLPDKICSEYLDYTLPVYITLTPHQQAFALLTSLQSSSSSSSGGDKLGAQQLWSLIVDETTVTRKALPQSTAQHTPQAGSPASGKRGKSHQASYELVFEPDMVTYASKQLIGATTSSSPVGHQQQRGLASLASLWPFSGAPVVQMSLSRDHTATTLSCLSFGGPVRTMTSASAGGGSLVTGSSISAASAALLHIPTDPTQPFLPATNPPGTPLWVSPVASSHWSMDASIPHDICSQILQTVTDAPSSPWMRALSHQFTAITRQQQQHYDRLMHLSRNARGSAAAADGTSSTTTTTTSHQQQQHKSNDSVSGLKLTLIFTVLALLTGSAILYTNLNSGRQLEASQQVQVRQPPSPHGLKAAAASPTIFHDYDSKTMPFSPTSTRRGQ